MRQAQTFDFNFKNVEKQYESYQGINVKLRYVKVPFGTQIADADPSAQISGASNNSA